MASATIYPEHREILDGLISSSKVASQLGAVATGPFRDQRDAYILAASIGIALGKPAAEADIPKTKTKDAISIRDHVIEAAEGGRELGITAVLLQEMDPSDETEVGLRSQLEQIAEGDLSARIQLASWLYEGRRHDP
jgi:hypothetical protein